MNKCEHGQKIIYFCASQNCQYKQAAGCQICIKKYHSHITNTNIINEETVLNVIKKYALQNPLKPKCRILQESIYNYFNAIKTQLINSLEAVSKSLINQVGFPFLHKHNITSTYKRLKNKQYKKIVQKEFKVFYQISNRIQEKQFLKQEGSIYEKQTRRISELVNSIEHFIGAYQQISKKFQLNFVHDRTLITKINDVLRTMPTQTNPIHKEDAHLPPSTSSSPNKSKLNADPNNKLQQIKKMSEMKMISLFSNTAGNPSKEFRQNDNFIDIRRQQQKSQLKYANKKDEKHDNKVDLKIISPDNKNIFSNNNSSVLSRFQKQRPPSIDRKILIKHRFNNASDFSPKTKQTQNGLTSSQKEIDVAKPNGNIQTLKQELNYRQMDINQKKKMLLDMMKTKEQRSSPKNKSKSKLDMRQSIGLKPVLPLKENLVYSEPQQQNSAQHDSFQSAYENNNRHQAFAKLPAEQISKKSPQKQEVKKKLIVVPTTINGFSIAHSGNNDSMESASPLYRKKMTESRSKLNKVQSAKSEKHQVQTKANDVQIQFKQNEQKSLALFLKSLNLKAEEALTYLCSSLKYADNNLSAAEYLSYLYLQLNRPKDCLLICNKILQKYSSNIEEQLFISINNNKSVALNTLGRYSESIVILQKCIKCKEKDLLYKNLADAYLSIGMYEKAIYNYEKCLKLNYSFDQAHYNLAVCLYMQANYNNARFQIKKALQLQPKNEQYLQLQLNIELKNNNKH